MKRRYMALLIALMLVACSTQALAVRGYVGNLVHKGVSGFDVTAYGAKGDGATDDEPAFTLAIAAAAGGRVIVPEAAVSYKLSANVTVPAGVTVVFQQGGLLSIDNTFTFAVNGSLAAGLYQIFSGAGTATIAAGRAREVYPQWWGALGDDSNDDTTAIQDAITAANGGRVYFTRGTYKITTALDMDEEGTRLVGESWRDTIIKVYGGVNGIEITDEECSISDLSVMCDSATEGTGLGIKLGGDNTVLAMRTKLTRVWVGARPGTSTNFFAVGIDVEGVCYYSSFISCYLRANTIGIKFYKGTHPNFGPNECHVFDTNIHSGDYGIQIGESGTTTTEIRVAMTSIEGTAVAGINVESNGNIIESCRFEPASGDVVILASGVLGNVLRHNFSSAQDDKYVTDSSTNATNTIEKYHKTFGITGAGNTPYSEADYGGTISLGYDAGTNSATDWKFEATKGDLQLEASTGGKKIDVLSDTEITGTLDVTGNTTISGQFRVIDDTVDDFRSSIILTSSVADNTNKGFRYGTLHYDVDEQPVYLLNGLSTAGVNQFNIGGGTSLGNAVTEINFYTASNRVTTTGTKALRIESDGDVIALFDLVAATLNFAADAEASDTYVIALSPAPAAYTTGMPITFTANTANTGACTVNANSLGAKSLKLGVSTDPGNDYIKAGSIVHAVYDGTNFQMLQPAAQ